MAVAGEDSFVDHIGAIPVSIMKHVDEISDILQSEKENRPENLESYNAFKEYIETFLVKIYQCKLCQFKSARKHTIGDHIKDSHSATGDVKATSSSSKAGGTQPNETGTEVQNAGLPIVSLTDLTTQQNDTVSLSNALEVLMGLGNECTDNLSNSDQGSKTPKRKQIGRRKKSNDEDFVNIPISSCESPVKVQQVAPLANDTLAAAAAAADLDEDDVDDDDNPMDDDPDYLPSDGAESDTPADASQSQFKRTQVSQETPQPIQENLHIQNKTAPVLQSVDVSAIAKTAALSNPDATTITVVQHSAGEGPPTTIQFKKSRKSDAIIPTRESLGIISPFMKLNYQGAKVFACSKCHSRYKTQEELDRHVIKKHQRTRKFLCEICGEALATRASVRHHVSRKHPDDTSMFKCEHCDYMTRFETRMKIHSSKHNSDFFCDLCNKCYVSEEKLNIHFKSPMHKNALNPIICEHCGYSTKKRDNFLVHMRKHTGEKPYRCTQCDYASSDGSTLKKHVMAKHSNIRPFKCESPMCNFSCVDKKGLTIHMRKHTGERPFKCSLCNYAAKRRSALNVHMQTHTKMANSSAMRVVKSEPQQRQMDGKGKTQQRPPPPEVASYETVTITELPKAEATVAANQFTTMTNYQPNSAVQMGQGSEVMTPQGQESAQMVGNSAGDNQTFEVQPQISTATSLQGQVATPSGTAHTFTVQIPTDDVIAAQDPVTEQAVSTIWQSMQ